MTPTSLRLKCNRPKCGKLFDSAFPKAYCDGCTESFQIQQKKLAQSRVFRTPNTGYMTEPAGNPKGREIPETVEVAGHHFCGLCGSENLFDIYGCSPYGMGRYCQCGACGSVMDFEEDTGE